MALKKQSFSRSQLIVFSLIFAVIGGIVIYRSFAANPNLPGDINNDNTVNITDLSILLTNYGTTNTTADLNADNTVNITDLSILLSHYGQSTTTGWTFCANENSQCSFSGTMSVRYGANGTYTTKTFTNGTACDNNAFGGDPLPGVVKHCDYQSITTPPPPPPGNPPSYFNGPLGNQNLAPSKPGAFLIDYPGAGGYTWTDVQNLVLKREQDIGRKFDGIGFQYWGGGGYQGISNCIDTSEINEQREQWIHSHGAMPVISWSPYRSIAEVNSGAVDSCFVAAAQHFKQDGFPVMLRMWWEFDNDAGFPWSVGGTSNIGQPFITAWQRVVNIFKQQGATNVGFWWTPLEGSPHRDGITASYPGDAYVDWVGSDVYNGCYVVDPGCYSTPLHSGWAPFVDAANYKNGLNQYDQWNSHKPFVYGEVGTGLPSADGSYPTYKGDWFRAIPGVLKNSMPNVKGITFFDQDVSGFEGSRANWFVDYPTSNPDTYAGFKTMSNDPWFNAR